MSNFQKNCYEGVQFNVISVMRGLVGVKFQVKRYISLDVEWPITPNIFSFWMHLHYLTIVYYMERGGSVVECRTRNRESPGSNPL